ncbi:MAG: DUF3152 domain-containing protein [Acidimicrobiia bacterium]|nr:DUF3152 domain-containing protein [Acidimicrobiia bacterium]
MLTALALLALAGCSGGGSPQDLARAAGTTSTSRSTSTSTSSSTTMPAPARVVIRYRIERDTDDAATANFASTVDATLHDPRGWTRAGFVFEEADNAPYTILLAEGPEVQQRCRPYDTYGKYSCQIGPLVAITADRWRSATPEWTADLHAYRQMVVDHEVGHLLGLHHRDCPGAGSVAPVMLPQSTELHGCLPNPWPLPAEVTRAARHDLPLAPGYEPGDPRDTP